jgi:hypothetical protein
VNETDVRDKRVGAELEMVVRNLEPRPTLDRVTRSGSRRRLVRMGVAYATVIAFVGGAIWAGALVRAERSAPSIPGSLATFTSSAVPWTFERPSAWDVATMSRAGPDHIANVLSTMTANGPMPEGAGAYGPNASAGASSAFGEDGVVVIIRRTWTHAAPLDIHPSGPGPFVDDAQNPGWTFRERARCDGTLCFHVIEWIGPEGAVEDRAAAAAIADSVRLGDIERWTETEGGRTTLHDEDDRFTVTYPADWFASDRPINTWVSSPFEILALATYPLRVGGEAVVDFQLPSKAVEDLGTNDILIWLNESGDAGAFTDRPQRLEPSEPCGGENWDRLCSEPSGATPRLSIPGIHAWWLGFHDAGRGFYVFVGMGEQAYRDPARAGLAWQVLDTLRFLPR